METIRLTGRGSRLSLLQLEKVRQRIEAVFPGIKVTIITRGSRGDALQDVPLHTVEGTDFFTQEIFDALEKQEADIAVHSLKDMSSEHFFGSNRFAVVDRDDVRDVAIFQNDIEEKIARGEKIIVGTCSPRREEMVMGFLQKALPQLNSRFRVETKSIRGNVDTRLGKLDGGEYDGIILATAGLNRLLASHEDAPAIKRLLAGKKLMLLPLIECVPAPCQGAIVAEANPSNRIAVDVLNRINDPELMAACVQEKRIAGQYGVGCLQKFGVTSIRYGNRKTVYAAGKDSEGNNFSNWIGLPEIKPLQKKLFSTSDYMGKFFGYDYVTVPVTISEDVVYVANYKAISHGDIAEQLKNKQVWAAGTKTWLELARKGIWVQGSADAFGLEFLQPAWQMPLINMGKKDVAVITHRQSAGAWSSKGWKTYGTYSIAGKKQPGLEEKLKEADMIFWTSFHQFLQYRGSIRASVVHACPYGETAEQLRTAGIDPIVFPGIKAFQQWKQTSGL